MVLCASGKTSAVSSPVTPTAEECSFWGTEDGERWLEGRAAVD